MEKAAIVARKIIGGSLNRQNATSGISSPAGAILLAKSLNDYTCCLNAHGACEFFASKLAPTLGLDRRSSVSKKASATGNAIQLSISRHL
ncbi:hypothetical protein EXW72_24365 [Pseudomonas sp. BCA14]|nr:hypothetical protein EXW71_21280 [Pseudomonas sp. BCA17]TFF09232.1 hypothetical protein EXW70_09295 [Pseudomonas sp. JMN1]TFF19346.1 hypothetical protein EXW72_24365 [Pseudomonas sp. BCA14]TFF21426.1 hypothetical protein EXW73_20985 [Pseudomonas sp. BCA13]